MAMDEDKTPGDEMRDILGDALGASESEMQALRDKFRAAQRKGALDLLDQHLAGNVKLAVQQAVERTLMDLRNTDHALNTRGVSEEERREIFLSRLANGQVVPRFGIQIMVPGAEPPTVDEIKGLSGYIALHELARKLDIAVSYIPSEGGEGSRAAPATLSFDLGKSYEEGRGDQPDAYPYLPPLPPRPTARPTGGSLDL